MEVKEYLVEITEIHKLQGMLAGWLNWSDVKTQFVFVKDSKIKIRWFFVSISVPRLLSVVSNSSIFSPSEEEVQVLTILEEECGETAAIND